METQAEHWGGRGGSHWVEFQTHYDEMLREFGRHLLDAAKVTAGERALDVGCGCGETTLELARRVGPRGSALGVDLSPPMLGRARERAAAGGLENARFVHADAQAHRFEPASIDVGISRFGVMFFDDPRAAFANIAKAFRGGGRIAFVCWQEVPRNEWLLVPGMAAAPHVGLPQMGEPGAPGPFSLADPDRLRGILESSGWQRVQLDTLALPMRLGADVDSAVAFFTRTEMARRLFGEAEPERVEKAIEAIRAALAPYASPAGLQLQGTAWLVTAVVAGGRA